MTISEAKVVSLTYELRVDAADGDIVERVEKDQPFVFLYGSGNLLPEFEDNLKGLKPGEAFEFMIQSENAYGEVNDKALVTLGREVFTKDGQFADDLVQIGHYIPMKDQEGNTLKGLVVEVNDTSVIMDFNHPLAGKNLHFKGEIESIREATEEELDHGHVHGPGGHHHH